MAESLSWCLVNLFLLVGDVTCNGTSRGRLGRHKCSLCYLNSGHFRVVKFTFWVEDEGRISWMAYPHPLSCLPCEGVWKLLMNIYFESSPLCWVCWCLTKGLAGLLFLRPLRCSVALLTRGRPVSPSYLALIRLALEKKSFLLKKRPYCTKWHKSFVLLIRFSFYWYF